MSSIASTYLISPSDLALLREAAVPKKRWFGRTKDDFESTLSRIGTRWTDFELGGALLATALSYLEEAGIDLMTSEHQELATFISTARQCSCFVLTSSMRDASAEALTDLPLSAEDLTTYYEEFHETSAPGSGEAMIAGIEYLRSLLEQVSPERVAFVKIG